MKGTTPVTGVMLCSSSLLNSGNLDNFLGEKPQPFSVDTGNPVNLISGMSVAFVA